MSVLDQIRQLDEQKKQLLNQAKEEALTKATNAIAELREIGFNYRLVEGGDTTLPTAQQGGRRTGIREAVLDVIKSHPTGITRADILEQMDAKGDKRAEQSISNALSNAKKQDLIRLEDGKYLDA